MALVLLDLKFIKTLFQNIPCFLCHLTDSDSDLNISIFKFQLSMYYIRYFCRLWLVKMSDNK